MNILIAGFPYVRENYFATFRYYPDKMELQFLLPEAWPIKGGKYIYKPPTDGIVYTTKAYFYHSNYPVIGGLLKGWLPYFPFFIRDKKYDLIYSCSEPTLLSTLYQAIFSKIFGAKHVVFSWENIPFENKYRGLSKLVHMFVLKLNLWLSDAVICGNEKGAEIFKKLTKKTVAVIPMNGVDPIFFDPQKWPCPAKEDNEQSRKMVFGFIGAIGYRKGIHLIIKALAGIISEIPNVHLVLVGSGEYENEIEKLIDQYGLHRYITRKPWLAHAEVAKLLNCFDVFIYPSLPYAGWEEQFGYSMAEASLMEIPVIASRSGSINEIVVDGETGILVEPGDPLQLRGAMLRLACNKELRVRMGKAGREYIQRKFDHKVVAKKYYNFFHKLIV